MQTTAPRDIVMRLNRLGILQRIGMHRIAAHTGLYMGQLPILEWVLRFGESTQKQLADALQVSPPSVANSIKRMQRTGLLQKSADQHDLRYNRITITERGRRLAARCRAEFDQLDAQMLRGLTTEQLQQLQDILDTMIRNLTTDDLSERTFFSLVETERQLQIKNRKENPDV